MYLSKRNRRHLIEELPGISGETFDIAPLPFRIKRVKGERRFSRTAQAGNDDQFLTWNLQVEVLQIVLARTTDFDNLLRHSARNVEAFNQA